MEDNELTPQREVQAETLTTENVSEEKTTESNFNNLPKLEDLLKSEQEIKPAHELKGLKAVEQDTVTETKTFTRKEDEKKVFVKRRLKILTAVYTCVAVLLFGFVIFNAVTLAILDRGVNTNANTIQSETIVVQELQGQLEDDLAGETFNVKLNTPRDYDDDTGELSFVDKLMILFRSIFG